MGLMIMSAMMAAALVLLSQPPVGGTLAVSTRICAVTTWLDPEVIKRLLTNRCATWAVVGSSANTERTAHGIGRYLRDRLGMNIVPVNLRGEDALGERGYRRLADIPDSVQVVDCFVNSQRVGAVVDEAIAEKARLGIEAVWLQLALIDAAAGTTCPRSRLGCRHEYLSGHGTSCLGGQLTGDRIDSVMNPKNMVWVPGGTFLMGAATLLPEERPAHHVSVDRGVFAGSKTRSRSPSSALRPLRPATSRWRTPTQSGHSVRAGPPNPALLQPGSLVFLRTAPGPVRT